MGVEGVCKGDYIQSYPKQLRSGLALVAAVTRFSDEKSAEQMFVEARWPDGVRCPRCASANVKDRPTRKPAPFRCHNCRKDFSVKTGTVMQGSNLPLSKWALVAFLMTTNLKGVSSMKLHRDLGITQKTAWHLAHRIRKAWETDKGLFTGPVEVDETYIGGKERNKHADQKRRAGRGPVGKTAVVGVKDRDTNQVSAAAVQGTDRRTLQGFVAERTVAGTRVYTDEHGAYHGMPNHVSVRHSTGEYVRDGAHSNGIESFWSMLKRGVIGTYHHISEKHTGRYATEFSGRHNKLSADTLDQMQDMIIQLVGKRLRYQDLIA